MKPVISVILPVYNAEKFIGSSMDCILNQSFGEFEFLILNDGSDDRTKEIILSKYDKRINYMENGRNLGLIKSLNKAIYFSKGKYIARMDADDLCDKTRFEKQIEYLNEEKAVSILGTRQYEIGTNRNFRVTFSCEENRIRLLREPVVGHSTVMIRSEVFKKYNLYYDRLALYAEDYKLWVDASLHGLRIANLSDSLCGYRVHKRQVSQLFVETQQYISQKIRLLYGLSFFPEIIWADTKKYLQFILGDDTLAFDDRSMIAEKLIQANGHQRYFDQELFIRFVEDRPFPIQSVLKDFIRQI